MAKFFIDRPVFAWVLALIIVLGGAAILQLPIAQYPNIAPPIITVSTTYPGASAKTIEDTVVTPIEQELNGAPNLLYYESQSESSGLATINISFAPGSSSDLNSVEVQNRLKRVEARLPAEVRQQGVVDKAGNNYMMFITVSSNPATRMRSSSATSCRRRWSTRSAACPAWVRPTCSVPNTRCASGWIRPS
jgi:multidrug efflux pump